MINDSEVLMEDRDTIKLLKECDAGSKMAVSSLNDIMDKIENSNLRKLLDETKDHHEKLGNEIHEYLNRCACSEKEPNPIAKGMSWLKTKNTPNKLDVLYLAAEIG